MYKKFNCKISDSFYESNQKRYYDIGNEIYEKFKKQSKDCLKPFMLDNGRIDGSALKNDWFKISGADIFISHSHKDEEKVIAFAGWLKVNFGLTAFIDSCVWGNSDELQREIDNKYCINPNGVNYNYDMRNYSTSHVHTMLSTALLEMIDKTECLMFYNTPQSICVENELDAIINSEKTLSPWIYHELLTANTIQPRKPKRDMVTHNRLMHFYIKECRDSSFVKIEYNVGSFLENMPILNSELLYQWKQQYDESIHPLDLLYVLV